MADRTSRSATRRTTPQSPRVPQSPPRQILRSMTSRIIDSESSRVGLKHGQKKARQMTRTGATTDYDGLQQAQRGKGRAQPRPLQDLATVVEDQSILYPNLPKDEVNEADQSAGRGQALQKRFSGASSAFSGNTARISGSAPSWADSDSAEEVSKGTSKISIKNEPAINAKIRPPFQALPELLDTPLQQMDVPPQPSPNADGLGNSNTRFNSPKTIQGTAGYLKQTKANRKVSENSQKPPKQSSESVRNVSVEATANPSVRASTAPAKMQIITVESAEKVFERLQAQTNSNREYGLQTRIDRQHRGIEDSIAPSPELRQGLNIMARRLKERKAQLEVDHNKENLTELPGGSRQPQYHTYQAHSTQGGKKKHFIDPQPNAERLRFDDSQDSQQHIQRRRKRQRDDLETVADNGDHQVDTVEVSEDEGFQQDRRAISAVSKASRTRVQNRVVREPVVHQRLSPKRVRTIPRHDNLDDEPRGAVTRHDQEQTPEPTQFESYKKANEMAKRNVAVVAKKVQTRKPWTDEETETLISLIGDHGISWKLLKEHDSAKILENRDQVALKDKARNMKFDYLKAGPFLPQNFENVPLNKMQSDKLRSLGIIYDPTTGQRDDREVEATDTDE